MAVGLQTDFLAPPVERGKFKLRPYQVAQNAAIDVCLATARSTLMVAAVGTGKTVAFCEQARKRDGCLVLAHRDSLIQQAAEKLELATGEPIAIEKASQRAHFGAKFIVASVQTLRGERLRRFALRFPSLGFIITDEAHRSPAKSYRAIYEAFPSAKLLGVTATPDRSDGVGLRAIFETVAHEYNIIDATVDGWLTPLSFRPVQSSVDLDAVKVTKQTDGETDFDQAQLDDAVSKEAGRMARAALKALDELGPMARMIGFAPGVKTAHAAAAACNDLRPGSACVVDGEMSDNEKRPIMAAFKSGEARIAWNVGVLTEGYDDETLMAIFDGAPTKSRLRATQKWGRVTRVWPNTVEHLATAEERRAAIAASPKPWGYVFDLVMNSSKHDVIGPTDVLAGAELPANVRAAAKAIIRAEGGNVPDAVKKAREELQRRAIAQRMAAAAKVTIGKPRSIFDRAGIEWLKKTALPMRAEDMATQKQIGVLKWRGIPVPSQCSKRMFARLKMLDESREAKGLCRLGGVERLRAHGIDAWEMTKMQAERTWKAVNANGGEKLTAEQLEECMNRTPGDDDL